MSNPEPPPGWDEIPEEMLEAARAMRQIYLTYIAVGFAAHEAAMIIGAMFAANGMAQGTSIPPSPGS